MDTLQEEYFGKYFDAGSRRGTLAAEERAALESAFDYVDSRFARMKYILGLAIDFILLAQSLATKDKSLKSFRPKYTEDGLFGTYILVESVGERQANTLTLTFSGEKFGIRKLEEHVLKYFVAAGKSSYPSAYVYNTGQWAKYKALLVFVFSLSNFGRFTLLERLLSFGHEKLLTSSFSVVEAPSIGIFEYIVANYVRSDASENGGLAMQAIAYGYISETHKHLNILASGVRTGSARQKRFGDIDCYASHRLAISFEVKDISLNAGNYGKQIGQFVQSANKHQVLGVIVCADYTSEVAAALGPTTTHVLSIAELLAVVRVWDPLKQSHAIGAVFHFLANIEQNEAAVRRLSDYISAVTEDSD
jgi:hypothetical protein